MKQLKPQPVLFPTFEIATNPQIRIADIKARIFSPVESDETRSKNCVWIEEELEEAMDER
jgi:negative regulator of sigma E activity